MARRDNNDSPGLPCEGRSLSCKHRHDSNPDVSCPPEVECKAGPWLDLLDRSRLKRREEPHDRHPLLVRPEWRATHKHDACAPKVATFALRLPIIAGRTGAPAQRSLQAVSRQA